MKKIIYATLRDAYNKDTDESLLHIECRFDNGEKYAPIEIVNDFEGAEELGLKIVEYINQK